MASASLRVEFDDTVFQGETMKAPAPAHNPAANDPAERPDLAAWRQRHELRRSNAARPIPSARTYRRSTKHRKRESDS
ncbi:hypothetical protein [Nocardia sp. NPDC020380]|uniref:hypothetical protein n=1 Tax=Nocardia sp. NPDC020380 TaxID=3364309 RepID=UPI00379985EB